MAVLRCSVSEYRCISTLIGYSRSTPKFFRTAIEASVTTQKYSVVCTQSILQIFLNVITEMVCRPSRSK